MTAKEFEHCKDASIIWRVLEEIRERHTGGYALLLQSITRQISEYHRKSVSKCGKEVALLVGLSGGIDSSMVTCLAARAVGVDNVIPITMPARSDDRACIELSDIVREFVGINNNLFPYTISIEGIVSEEIRTVNALGLDYLWISKKANEQTYDMKIRIGNFASRARVSMLYDLAKALNGRILGSGNRTEFMQGFAAKYGTPISYDYGVLDALYKVDIIELAKLIGMPSIILESTPTTGYFLGQTHELELGASLEEQDVLVYLLFEKKITQKAIVESYGFEKEYVQLMYERYRSSAHKRMLKQQHVILEEYH